MASAKNELPTFGKNAELDESIVDNTSGLKDTGFQPNTTIKSAEMNTYIKAMIEALNGIVDCLYRENAGQNPVKADSLASQWQDYFQKGLIDLIANTVANDAVHADSADTSAEVDTLANNDSSDNANVRFTIGSKQFSKTVNNVKNAEKLKNARTISVTGDATGSTSFDGSSDVAVNVKSTITNAKSMVDSSGSPLTVGNSQCPVYFSNGVPEECNLYNNVGTYELTKESNGTFSLKTLSDRTHFLAYVEIYNSDNTLATGIAEFNLGVMQSDLTGVCIYSNTTTYAFVNTNAYGDALHSKAVVAKMQAIHGGLVSGNIVSVYNDSSTHHIKITKIAQLAVSVNPIS